MIQKTVVTLEEALSMTRDEFVDWALEHLEPASEREAIQATLGADEEEPEETE